MNPKEPRIPLFRESVCPCGRFSPCGRFNVEGDGKADCEEHVARVAANQAALDYLERLAESDAQHGEQLTLLQAQYHERLAQLESGEDSPIELDRPVSTFRRFGLGALQVEHQTLIDLRNKHRINDETLHVVQ
ncbi:MAG: Na+/H+ antiporter [Chthoniobacteraceae bacterium]|nr:Na+/H+ antiporter [Chthoniobacteraceae bacterium]